MSVDILQGFLGCGFRLILTCASPVFALWVAVKELAEVSTGRVYHLKVQGRTGVVLEHTRYCHKPEARRSPEESLLTVLGRTQPC